MEDFDFDGDDDDELMAAAISVDTESNCNPSAHGYKNYQKEYHSQERGEYRSKWISNI